MELSPLKLILVLITLPISFAPTIVAFARHHTNKWIVFAINFFLGWTGICWIGALVWAIVGKPANSVNADRDVFN